jgi:hypothetical protein
VQRDFDKAWSIAVINREMHPVAITMMLAAGAGDGMRRPVSPGGCVKLPNRTHSIRCKKETGCEKG